MKYEDRENHHGEKFPKSARLRLRTLVKGLFTEGKSIYEWPLRLTWRIVDEASLSASFRDVVPDGIGEVQMMVTIPKRKMRHAVDRVRMRRLVKESYRRRRWELCEKVHENPCIRTLSLSYVYIADKKTDFSTIDRKMKFLLRKLDFEIDSIYEKK